MAGLADRIDGFQRRHPAVGFPLAVTYKFFDDQSNYLAATVTYYTFAAIFPLLLISSSVLGFVLQGNPELKDRVLDSALSQFPIVGTQLGTQEGLRGSVTVVVTGGIVALYGVLGLGQATQNAVHVAWSLPRNSRPNPIMSRVNSAALMLIAGLAVILVATATSTVTAAAAFGVVIGTGVRWLVDLGSIALTALVLATLMQFATPKREKWRYLLPGAFLTAVLWQLLQRAGAAYVQHVIGKADVLGAAFAVPLGLLALLYIASVMAMIGLQVNVVLRKHLWPRALLTPFTDNVHLTDADKKAYTAYAMATRHKGFERIGVHFDASPKDVEDAEERAVERAAADRERAEAGTAEEKTPEQAPDQERSPA